MATPNPDLTTAINAFKSAIYGEEVRDGLVDVANAVLYAIEHQITQIDTGFTESGAGADAKAVGDKTIWFRGQIDFDEVNPISIDLNDYIDIGIWQISAAAVYHEGYLLHKPEEETKNMGAYLLVIRGPGRQNTVQVYFGGTGNMYWRRYLAATGYGWNDWARLANQADLDSLRDSLGRRDPEIGAQSVLNYKNERFFTADTSAYAVSRGYISTSGDQTLPGSGYVYPAGNTFDKRAQASRFTIYNSSVMVAMPLSGYSMAVFWYDDDRNAATPTAGSANLAGQSGWRKDGYAVVPACTDPAKVRRVRISFAHDDADENMTDDQITAIGNALRVYYPDNFDRKLAEALYTQERKYLYNDTGLFPCFRGYVTFAGNVVTPGSSYVFDPTGSSTHNYRGTMNRIGIGHHSCMVCLDSYDYEMNVFWYESDDSTATSANKVKNSGFTRDPYFIVPACTDDDKTGSLRICFRRSDGRAMYSAEEESVWPYETEFVDDFEAISNIFRIYYLDAGSGSASTSGIVEQNDPAETSSRLQQISRQARVPQGNPTLKTPPLVLLHFSDIHGDKTRLQRVVDYYDKYSTYINDILHTGDIVSYYATNGLGFWNDVSGAESILNCIGNHDTCRDASDYSSTEQDAWIQMPPATCYETYFAPYVGNWGGVTFRTVNVDGGIVTYPDYYKDYATQGVRLIVLDAMHQTAEQLAWFAGVLESARTNSLHVVAATHVHPTQTSVSGDPAMTVQPGSTFDNYRFIRGSRYSTSASAIVFPSKLEIGYAAAVKAFQDAGGYFACWLHGHSHYDVCTSIVVADGAVPQLNLGVSNAGISYANARKKRTAETKTQDDFNVVSIDTFGCLVKVMGVGATTDYWMQRRETMCWNYETGELVHG